MKRLKRHTRLNNIWLYALALLKKRDLHAYTLNQEIEKRFGFKPSRIMTYIVLNKIEDEKFISSYEKDRRKYYKLTKRGRNELTKAKKYFSDLAKKL